MDETGAEPSAKPAQTPPEDPLLAPRLSAGQLALLHRYGQERPTVAVPVDRVQRLFAQDQALADLIMQTSFRRRQWLLAERAGMRIIGSRSSADARRLREFAARNRLACVWLDVETTPAASMCSAITASARMKPRSWSCAVVRSCAICRTRSWRGPQRAPRPAHRIRRPRPLRPLTAPPTEIDPRRHS